MISVKCIELCNYHCHLILKHHHHPQRSLLFLFSQFHFPAPAPAPGKHCLLSVFTGLHFLHILDKLNHAVCGYVSSFFNIISWGSSILYCVSESIIFLLLSSIPFCVHIHLVCSLKDGLLDYFHILAVMNKHAMNICVQVFEWT